MRLNRERKGIRARLVAFVAPEFQEEAPVAHAPSVGLREIVRRFWPYARPYRKYIWLSLPFIFLYPAIQTVTIWMFKLLVDDVLVPRDFGPLGWLALAYIGLTLLGGAIAFCDSYLSAWVAQRFLISMRASLFDHLQAMSPDFFQRRRLGDLLARLSGDVGAIEGFLITGSVRALSQVIRIVFFAGALFYLEWRLALVSLVVAPFFWFAARKVSKVIKRAAREKRRRSGSLTAVAEESLSHAALVQASNRQGTERERFEREALAGFAAHMASTRIRALFRPLVDLVELGGVLVVIAVGTWQMSKGSLTLGELLIFVTYLSQLYRPVRTLTRMFSGWYAAAASAERIIEVLDERPAVEDRPNARSVGRAAGRIALEEVSFSYPGADRPAVQQISLSVEPGETVALVGPSGSGKTTLAKLVLRFYDPSSGTVRLDGHDVRDLKLESLRDNIAVLLQETLVFDGTVRENIEYGRPGCGPDAVVAAAKAADAHDFITQLPQGYDTRLGQRGNSLSGGQRQRIAIARAMVREAPVLILDEPTTGLDAASGTRILEPLRRLMGGRATLIISHNLMTVRDADRIIVLREGRVVEVGDHEQLIAAAGDYARLYSLQRWRAPKPDVEQQTEVALP